jgi:hypothetical protein
VEEALASSEEKATWGEPSSLHLQLAGPLFPQQGPLNGGEVLILTFPGCPYDSFVPNKMTVLTFEFK